MGKCFSIVVFTVFLSLLFSSTSCFAGASFCSVATVVKTGASPSGSVIYLRNNTAAAVGTADDWEVGVLKPFIIADSIGNAGLATALTALSLGKTVLAGSPDGTYPNWGLISFIYINK